jgi:DNA-binding response OmpR family regulator
LEISNTFSITRRENRNHMRVLIVEDEPGIRQTMLRVFEREGHVVDEAADGQSGLSKAVTGEHDVVILDVLLPILDGLQVCKAIRAAGVKTPVLMLTALSDVDDRVNGLDSGADDYLGKPFAFKELLARVRALGRRGGENVEDTTLRCEDLELDLLRHTARRGDRRIELTTTEFRLLEYLCRNSTHVLSRSKILDEVWGFDYDGESNVVDTYVHYLRRKIDTYEPRQLIRTVRGYGYALGGG